MDTKTLFKKASDVNDIVKRVFRDSEFRLDHPHGVYFKCILKNTLIPKEVFIDCDEKNLASMICHDFVNLEIYGQAV